MPIQNYQNPFSQQDDELAALYDEARKNSEDDGVFYGGLKSGLYSLGSGVDSTLAAISRAVGLDSLAANRERAADEFNAQAAGAGYKTPAFADIDGVSGALDWATGMLSSNLPLLGGMAGSAALGGITGSRLLGKQRLAQAAGRNLAQRHNAALRAAGLPGLDEAALNTLAYEAEKAALPRSTMSLAVEQGLSDGNIGAKAGRLGGAFLPYATTTIGGTYDAIRNDPNATGTPEEQARAAILSGLGQSVIGTAREPLGIANKILASGKAAQLAKKAGLPYKGFSPLQTFGLATAGEGLTEGLENVIQQKTQQAYNPDLPFDYAQLAENALGGVVVGGALAAPTAAYAHLAGRNQQHDQPGSVEELDSRINNLESTTPDKDKERQEYKIVKADLEARRALAHARARIDKARAVKSYNNIVNKIKELPRTPENLPLHLQLVAARDALAEEHKDVITPAVVARKGAPEIDMSGTSGQGTEMPIPPAMRQEQAPTPAPTWDTIKPGDQVTLYRGESSENTADGEWWTTDPQKAAKYGRVTEVTLPAEIVGKHAAVGANGKDEFVFPTQRPAQLAQPVAEQEIAQQPDLPALEAELGAKGVAVGSKLDAGTSAVVMDTDQGALRIAQGPLTQRPQSAHILQPVDAGQVGGLHYELTPKVDTTNITDEDVATVEQALSVEGLKFTDKGKANVGRLPDGKLVVTDPGAVTKAGVPGEPLPKSIDPTGTMTEALNEIRQPEAKIKSPPSVKPLAGHDPRLADPEVLSLVKSYAQQAGWEQEGGGRLPVDDGKPSDTTTRIPRQPWWKDRPYVSEGRELTKKDIDEGMARLASGKKLTKAQSIGIKWLADMAEESINEYRQPEAKVSEPSYGQHVDETDAEYHSRIISQLREVRRDPARAEEVAKLSELSSRLEDSAGEVGSAYTGEELEARRAIVEQKIKEDAATEGDRRDFIRLNLALDKRAKSKARANSVYDEEAPGWSPEDYEGLPAEEPEAQSQEEKDPTRTASWLAPRQTEGYRIEHGPEYITIKNARGDSLTIPATRKHLEVAAAGSVRFKGREISDDFIYKAIQEAVEGTSDPQAIDSLHKEAERLYYESRPLLAVDQEEKIPLLGEGSPEEGLIRFSNDYNAVPQEDGKLLHVTHARSKHSLTVPVHIEDFLPSSKKEKPPIYFDGELISGTNIGSSLAEAYAKGEQVPIEDIFSAAIHAYEFRSVRRTVGKATVTDTGVSWVLEEDDYRTNPILDEYGFVPVKIHIEAAEGPAAMRRGVAKANEEMAKKGMFVVGTMDNKLFYGTKEQRAKYLEDADLVEKLEADVNLIERSGTILKKESGAQEKIQVGHITKRHNTGKGNKENPHDGVIAIVKGAELSQGVSRRKVYDPDAPNGEGWVHEYDKGILRSPAQSREIQTDAYGDIVVDKNGNPVLGGIIKEEEESLNDELQFETKKRGPRAEPGFEEIEHFKMFPPADQQAGIENYQGLFFGAQGAMDFAIRDRQENLDKANGLSLLSGDGPERLALGVPPAQLETPEKALKKKTQFESGTTRSYVLSSGELLDGSQLSDERVAELEKEFKEKYGNREYKRGISDCMLMPATFKEENEIFKKREGRGLRVGDIILLHRDPALPNGTAKGPHVFVGLATLENSWGTHDKGVVVHPLSPGWKESDGDFDGDSGVATYPDEHLRPIQKREDNSGVTAQYYLRQGDEKKEPVEKFIPTGARVVGHNILDKTIALPEPDGSYGEPQDLLSWLVEQRATGFSQMVGRIMSPAQKLAEIGLLDAPVSVNKMDSKGNYTPTKRDEEGRPIEFEKVQTTYALLATALAKGSVSAKKKAAYAKQAMEAYSTLVRETKANKPDRIDPLTGEPLTFKKDGKEIQLKDDYFVKWFGDIDRAPVDGSLRARQLRALAKQADKQARDEGSFEEWKQEEFELSPSKNGKGYRGKPVTKSEVMEVAAIQAKRVAQAHRNNLLRAALAKARKEGNKLIADKAQQRLKSQDDVILEEGLRGLERYTGIPRTTHIELAYRTLTLKRLFDEIDLFGGSGFHPEVRAAAERLIEQDGLRGHVKEYLQGAAEYSQYLGKQQSELDPLLDEDLIERIGEKRSELNNEIKYYYNIGYITGPELVAWGPQSAAGRITSIEDLRRIAAETKNAETVTENVRAKDKDGHDLPGEQVVSGLYQYNRKTGRFDLVERADGQPVEPMSVGVARFEGGANKVAYSKIDPLNPDNMSKILVGRNGLITIRTTAELPSKTGTRKVEFRGAEHFEKVKQTAALPAVTFYSKLSPVKDVKKKIGGQLDGDMTIISKHKPGEQFELAPRSGTYAETGKESEWIKALSTKGYLDTLLREGSTTYYVRIVSVAEKVLKSGKKLAPKVVYLGDNYDDALTSLLKQPVKKHIKSFKDRAKEIVERDAKTPVENIVEHRKNRVRDNLQEEYIQLARNLKKFSNERVNETLRAFFGDVYASAELLKSKTRETEPEVLVRLFNAGTLPEDILSSAKELDRLQKINSRLAQRIKEQEDKVIEAERAAKEAELTGLAAYDRDKGALAEAINSAKASRKTISLRNKEGVHKKKLERDLIDAGFVRVEGTTDKWMLAPQQQQQAPQQQAPQQQAPQQQAPQQQAPQQQAPQQQGTERFVTANGEVRYLSGDQGKALNMALDLRDPNKKARTMRIIGPAGTGKSTLVRELMRRWRYIYGEGGVHLASPTRRANWVLRQMSAYKPDRWGYARTMEEKPSTLEQLMGASFSGESGAFSYPSVEEAMKKKMPPLIATLLPGSVVIVDEISMMDAVELQRLKEWQKKRGFSVLLLGDDQQLPPVGADVAPAFREEVQEAKLNQVMRQKGGNPLLDYLTNLRNGVVGTLKTAFNPQTGEGIITVAKRGTAAAAANRLFSKEIASANMNQLRVIAPRNNVGRKWNQVLHTANNPEVTTQVSPGEVVIGYRNSPGAIENGVEYLVDSVGPEERATFEGISFRGNYVRLKAEDDTVETFLVTPKEKSNYGAMVVKTQKELNQLRQQAIRTKAWRSFYARKEELDELYTRVVCLDDIAHNGTAINAEKEKEALLRRMFDLAYASTVHKAQGGTVNIAVVDMDDLKSFPGTAEFKRKLLYTALSRASKAVVVVDSSAPTSEAELSQLVEIGTKPDFYSVIPPNLPVEDASQYGKGEVPFPGDENKPRANTVPGESAPVLQDEDRAALAKLSANLKRVELQNAADSIGRLMGHFVAPKVVTAEAMYDMLKASGNEELAAKILVHAKNRKAPGGARGVHFEDDSGRHYIYIAGAKADTAKAQVAVFAHELGHWLINKEWKKLKENNKDLSKLIYGDYKSWLKGKQESEDNFHEWLADNIANWILQDKKVQSATDSWFKQRAKQFAASIKHLWDILRNMFGENEIDHFAANPDAGKWMPKTLESVEAWMSSLAKNEEQIVFAYGPAPKGESIADRIAKRKARLSMWAATGQSDFELVNDMVPYIAQNLDSVLNPKDAMLLRRIATEPVMRRRLFQLLGKDSKAAHAIAESSDQAAAYLYVLASAGILAPSGPAQGILAKLKQAVNLYNRQLLDALPDEADEVLKGLNMKEVYLPDGEDLISHSSPAYRLYAERKHKYATGLAGALQRFGQGRSQLLGWYLDVPYQEIMQMRVPVLKDTARKLQSMAWELGGLKPGGMIERSKAQHQRFANRAAEVIGALSEDEKMGPFKKLAYPFRGEKASVPANVRKAFNEVRELLDRMFEYETTPDVAPFLKIKARADYWPFITDHEYIRENIDEVVDRIMADGDFVSGWKNVRDDYVRWIVENQDPGRAASVDAAVKEIEGMPLAEFVKTYMAADDEHLLPGWRLRKLEGLKTSTPGFRFANPRELDFMLQSQNRETHEYVVNNLLVTDPTKVLARYIRNSAKRVEHARLLSTLPEGGFKGVWEKAKEQGATLEQIQKFINYVDAINGQLGITTRDAVDRFIEGRGPDSYLKRFHSGGGQLMNQDLNAIRSWAHAYIDVCHLTLNGLTSLVDPLGSLVTTGNWKIFKKAMDSTREELVASMKGQPPSRLSNLIRMVGVTNHSFTNSDLQETYTGPDVTPEVQQLLQTWFKVNGVQWIGEQSSDIASRAAFIAIGDYATNISGNSEMAEESRQKLADLGLMPEDVAGHLETTKEGVVPTILNWEEFMKAPPEEQERDTRVRMAIFRHVEQSQMRPGPTTRSLPMSNPYFSLPSTWRGFILTFHNQIMKPAWAKLVEEGNAKPITFLALSFIPVLLFAEMVREAAKMALSDDRDEEGDKSWTPPYRRDWTLTDYVLYAGQKAGLLGTDEIIMDAVAPILQGNTGKGLASAAGVLGSDLYKAYNWGSIPLPAQDLTSNWGGRSAPKKEENTSA